MWLIIFKNIKNNLLRMKKGMSFAALYFLIAAIPYLLVFVFKALLCDRKKTMFSFKQQQIKQNKTEV